VVVVQTRVKGSKGEIIESVGRMGRNAKRAGKKREGAKMGCEVL
jgi:hypothetical protein